MNILYRRCIAAALILPASLPAMAQTTDELKFYVGASVGRAELPDRREQFGDQFLDLGFDSASTRGDDHDTGYRAYAGYQFSPYFGVEVAYVDLGRFEAYTTVEPSGTFTGKTTIRGAELSLVGRLPLGERFALYGRAGGYRGKVTTRYAGTGSVELVSGADTQRHTSNKASYALGVSYDFNPHWGARLEWARYSDLGDVLTSGKTDVDLASVGVTYRF